MEKRMCTVILMLLTLLAGCVTAQKTVYKYNGLNYATQEAAFRAQENLHKEVLNAVSGKTPSFGRNAEVVIPSEPWIRENLVTYTKSGIGVLQPGTKDKMVDFTARIDYGEFRLIGESIRKHGLFDDVGIRESDSPESTERGSNDACIYLVRRDEGPRWMLRIAASEEPILLPLMGVAGSPQSRVRAWLDEVTEILAGYSK